MLTIRFPMTAWKQGMAALGAVAGLALAPAPAHAQICGDFDEIAEDLLDVYLDQFGDFFGLSEKTCDSMTKTFYSACTTAVKDAAKCFDRQIGQIPKAAKYACAEASKNPSACTQDYKDAANDDQNQVDNGAEAANDDCGFAADDFFEFCRFGIP